MKRPSWLRQMKRAALKRDGVTFTQRVRKAVFKGRPIEAIRFNVHGKELETKVVGL